MNFNDFVKKNSLEFSDSDKKIYNFLSQRPNHFPSLTMQKMADGAGTSIASIQRFCKKLGYSGFQEFKFAFKNYLLQNQSNDISNKSQYLNEYAKIITQFTNQDKKDINNLISTIKNSPQIFSFGVFYSSIPARFLNMALIDNGYRSHYADNYVTGSHLLNSYTPKDSFIYFSISADDEYDFNRHFKDEFEQYKNTYLITFNPNSPIKKAFKNIILLPGREFILKSSIDPQSLFCLFVEYLINNLNS